MFTHFLTTLRSTEDLEARDGLAEIRQESHHRRYGAIRSFHADLGVFRHGCA